MSNTQEKKETLYYLKAHGHHFYRYLSDNPFAEEMKCRHCSYVIYPCFSEEEVTRMMMDNDNKIVPCQ